MRIQVWYNDSSHGTTNYCAAPQRRKPKGGYYPEDVRRFKGMQPRIERVARDQLGKAFVAANRVGEDMIELRVKRGTSRDPKTRFVMRNLLGWISLMDVEHGLSRR